MRVLFLDFDGVLNSERYMEKIQLELEKRHTQERGFQKRDYRDMIDPDAVARVSTILERTDAKVCVSSTWRKLFTIPELQTMLREKGFRGQLIGRTPDFWRTPELQANHGRRCRGHEIQYWLDRHKRYEIDRFAILDDDNDMAHLASRLVQTDALYGLQDEHVERAVSMLT